MDEPIIVTNGRFSISIETKGSIKNANFGRSIQLAPGKPDDVTAWKDIYGRDVFKHPRTGHWRYYPTPKDTASRMKKAGKKFETKQTTTTKQDTLSELYVTESLKIKSNKKLLDEYKNKLDPSWLDSSEQSISAIKNYFKDKGIKNVEYIGNKKLENFLTADVLVTHNDGTQTGVSLKKVGNSNMWNTTLATELGKSKSKQDVDIQDVVKNYLNNVNKALLVIANRNGMNISESDLQNNKKLRKKIEKEHGKQTLNIKGEDIKLNDYITNLHSNFKKEINSPMDSEGKETLLRAFTEKHTMPMIQKILDLIQKNKVIIASGNTIVDNNDSRIKGATLQRPIVRNGTSQVLLYLKTPNGERHNFGVVNPRQDGVGYGSNFRADVSFTRQFLNTKTND